MTVNNIEFNVEKVDDQIISIECVVDFSDDKKNRINRSFNYEEGKPYIVFKEIVDKMIDVARYRNFYHDNLEKDLCIHAEKVLEDVKILRNNMKSNLTIGKIAHINIGEISEELRSIFVMNECYETRDCGPETYIMCIGQKMYDEDCDEYWYDTFEYDFEQLPQNLQNAMKDAVKAGCDWLIIQCD